MHGIAPIRQILGNSHAIGIRDKQIPFAFLCRVIAACAGQVNLESGARLGLLDEALVAGSLDVLDRNRRRLQVFICFRLRLGGSTDSFTSGSG